MFGRGVGKDDSDNGDRREESDKGTAGTPTSSYKSYAEALQSPSKTHGTSESEAASEQRRRAEATAEASVMSLYQTLRGNHSSGTSSSSSSSQHGAHTGTSGDPYGMDDCSTCCGVWLSVCFSSFTEERQQSSMGSSFSLGDPWNNTSTWNNAADYEYDNQSIAGFPAEEKEWTKDRKRDDKHHHHRTSPRSGKW